MNVGCGPHNLLKDWWNIDIRKFRGIDEVMDVTQPWPYRELEYVYGEHFLEHLPLPQALSFLRHAWQSLKSGGAVRLSTPNLEWVLRTHFQFGKVDPKKKLLDTLKVNRAFHGWGHQFLYTADMLQALLGEVGFTAVAFFSYGESDDPELRNLERHGGFQISDGLPSVIIAEAKKEREQGAASGMTELFALLEEQFLRYVVSGH